MLDVEKSFLVSTKEIKTPENLENNDIPDFLNRNGEVPGNELHENSAYAMADAPILPENLVPLDSEQASMIAGALKQMPEFRAEIWQTLSPEQKTDVLNQAEQIIADIEKRQPPCNITMKNLGEGLYGYYSNGEIVLNEALVSDNSPEGLHNTLDTLIHEGRHAYQHYNLEVKTVHPNLPEVEAWRLNYQLGYENGECGIFDFQKTGLKHYFLQPVEVDARVFAENVLNDMNI